MGLYLSLSVYACSYLFLSVAACFLLFLFVFHLLRIQHIISIISFLFIIWVMLNTSSTYNMSFMYSLHSLYNNTRVTCSSALSGHPSSSCFVVGEPWGTSGQHVMPVFCWWVQEPIYILCLLFAYEDVHTYLVLDKNQFTIGKFRSWLPACLHSHERLSHTPSV